MPDRQPTIWPLLPHTAAKHSIFRRHLQAWFPKLSSWANRVQVIDGFAGPGEYLGGEPGSPLIALDVALSHRARLTSQIDFIFVEEDRARYEHLSGRLAELNFPKNVNVRPLSGSFKEIITAELARGRWPPSFLMIDPFGFEGLPMAVIQRVATIPHSEILVSFMYDSITRWLNHPGNASNFDELFGTTAWREALTITEPQERRNWLLQLYIRQLHSHGWKYVRSFEMRDDDDRTEYFLVFASNHIEGLKVMKEAMWKLDPSGAYLFSDATDQRQLTLFRPSPDYDQLKTQLVQRFGHEAEVKIEDIEEFVLLETAFRETHFNGPILRPMELSGRLIVLDGGMRVRRGVYPDGTVLKFLD